MSVQQYKIVTSVGTFISCETEFSFDDNYHWLGSSSLYVVSDSYNLRPYVVSGTNQLYYPRTGTGVSQYYTIQSVEVLHTRSFDVLPALSIVLLCCLIFVSIRSLLRRGRGIT